MTGVLWFVTIIMVWQVVSFFGAIKKATGGSLLSWMGLPIRLCIIIGAFGFSCGSATAEAYWGHSFMYGLGGSPHYWQETADQMGCTLNKEKLTLDCPPKRVKKTGRAGKVENAGPARKYKGNK